MRHPRASDSLQSRITSIGLSPSGRNQIVVAVCAHVHLGEKLKALVRSHCEAGIGDAEGVRPHVFFLPHTHFRDCPRTLTCASARPHARPCALPGLAYTQDVATRTHGSHGDEDFTLLRGGNTTNTHCFTSLGPLEGLRPSDSRFNEIEQVQKEWRSQNETSDAASMPEAPSTPTRKGSKHRDGSRGSPISVIDHVEDADSDCKVAGCLVVIDDDDKCELDRVLQPTDE